MTIQNRRFFVLGLLSVLLLAITAAFFDVTYREMRRDFETEAAFKEARRVSIWIQTLPDSVKHNPRQLGRWLQNLMPEGWFALYQNATICGTAPAGVDTLGHKAGTRLVTDQAGSTLALYTFFLNGEKAVVLGKALPPIGWFSLEFWMRFAPVLGNLALLLVLMLFFVYHSFDKPLSSVRSLAEHLQAGDFKFRINYKRKDAFTDTFNRLNRTLEQMGNISESYQKREKNIQNLLQALEESIVLLDGDLKVNTYNPPLVRLIQCPSPQLFNEYFSHILAENMDLRELLHRSKAFPDKALSKNLLLWLPNDRQINVDATVQSLPDGGFLIMFKDLSKIRELQNNLLRSMKFGIIANLVSSVSHEIRNPLSAVGIHAEILSNRLQKEYPELDERLKKSLNIIQTEIKRIHRIHTQFFNLARQREATLNSLKPNALVEDVINLVQHLANEQQIKLSANLFKGVDFIYGDADQIKQVLLNIVLNAFQAVDNGGEVKLRTYQDQRNVYFEIADNGCGIPEEVGDRIFDLYFTTKKDGGGIGLALCKKIIEAHEGQIRYQSVVGKGTVFTVVLPRQSQSRRERIQTRLESLQ